MTSLAAAIFSACLLLQDGDPDSSQQPQTVISEEAQGRFSSVRTTLRSLSLDAAKSGAEQVSATLVNSFVVLGGSQKQRKALSKSVDKYLEKGKKSVIKIEAKEKLAKKIPRVTEKIIRSIRQLNSPDAAIAWRVVNKLDSENEEARAALNYSRRGPTWVLDADVHLYDRKAETVEALQWLADYSEQWETIESECEVIRSMGVETTRRRLGGFIVETTLDPARRRAFEKSLCRSSAFLNWAVNGNLEARPASIEYLLFSNAAELQKFKVAASEILFAENSTDTRMWAKGSSEFYPYRVVESYRMDSGTSALSIFDRSMFEVRKNPLEDYVAGHMTPFFSEVKTIPTWLWVGLLNWAPMVVLGAPPITYEEVETENSGTTVSERAEEISLLKKAGVSGAREHMALLCREGRDPSLSLSFRALVPEISGDALMKAIFVAQFIHEYWGIPWFLKRHGSVVNSPDFPWEEKYTSELFEETIGMSTPEFESLWREWLLPEAKSPPGVFQVLLQGAESREQPLSFEGLLESVNRFRHGASLAPVKLNENLSIGCRLHAEFLRLNPQRQEKWPDAHMEALDEDGFSSEGAWAGLHSVIAGPPENALEAWLASFFHRLPLLNPGLLEIGIGTDSAGGITCLDASSLVIESGKKEVAFPFPGQESVPCSFWAGGEAPEPVPGVQSASLGFPVTLQLFGGEWNGPDLNFFLLNSAGDVVECYFSGPNNPLFPDLVPLNAYCLLPKVPLQEGMEYVAVAMLGQVTIKEWAFQTAR